MLPTLHSAQTERRLPEVLLEVHQETQVKNLASRVRRIINLAFSPRDADIHIEVVCASTKDYMLYVAATVC